LVDLKVCLPFAVVGFSKGMMSVDGGEKKLSAWMTGKAAACSAAQRASQTTGYMITLPVEE
jgi:hypothetical protein